MDQPKEAPASEADATKPEPHPVLAASIAGLKVGDTLAALPDDPRYPAILTFNLLTALCDIAHAQKRIADYMGSPGLMRRRWFLFGAPTVRRPWGPEDLDPCDLFLLRELQAIKAALGRADTSQQTLGARLKIVALALRESRVMLGLDPPQEGDQVMNRKKRRAMKIVKPTTSEFAAVNASKEGKPY
jgi:hypothetical protein